MIKVVIISSNAASELALLGWQSDIKVSVVAPTSIDHALQQTIIAMPHITLIEHQIESFSADVLCSLLYKQYPKSQTIIMTNQDPTFEMLESTGFSARGYITKEQRSSLAKAVRVVHEGEAWLPRKIVTEMLNRFVSQSLAHNEPQLQRVK